MDDGTKLIAKLCRIHKAEHRPGRALCGWKNGAGDAVLMVEPVVRPDTPVGRAGVVLPAMRAGLTEPRKKRRKVCSGKR